MPLHVADSPVVAPARLGLIGLAFFVSGASALAYQVVWQRILALHTGVGITSMALIVAAFMAGLGVGSHLGGRWSERVSPRAALRFFAWIELLVGLFAVVSCRFYYAGLESLVGFLWSTTLGAGVAHFLALLLPTGLMGMSLPFLVRAQVREAATASRTIATLYGVNVLGASIGALATPWFLMRFFGLEGAVLFGAAGNLTAALAAYLAGARPAEAEAALDPAAVSSEMSPASPPPASSLGLWTALYALSGFCALSLEIVWFRVIDVATKSTAFTFGTVLSIYLLGLGGGSLIGAWNAHRIRRPLPFFVLLQIALLTWSALSLTVLTRLPEDAPLYAWFFEYWRGDIVFQLGSDWDLAGVLRLYLLLPVFLYGIPTLLMGLSFTALQRAVQDDPVTSGRKVGLLQAANIAGCVAGSFLTGLVLLGRFGTTGSLRVLLAAGGVFLLVRVAREGFGPAVFGGAAALVLAAAALPSNERVWQKLHGVADPHAVSFIGEDATAVSAITAGQPGHWRVSVNGLPHSWVPFEGIHTLLGAVPAVVHPAPVDVAIVGLGSGETAWAASCRRETRSITVFEIAASQVDLLRRLTETVPLPALRGLLDDERVRVVAADGRHALKQGGRAYDLIQIDALYRTSAGSGNLYSVEFFQLCASRLKPGGIVCSQSPSRRVALSFQVALPHSIDFGNVLVGSNEPLPIDIEAWTARLRSAPVEAWFGRDVADGILDRLMAARPPWGNPNARRGLNYDLFPRDEFATPVAR